MHTGTARLRVARVTLALLLIIFPAQLAVLVIWGEPYPGLFQPKFGGELPVNGTVRAQEPILTVTFTDGSSSTFSHLQVMDQAKSLPLSIFRSAFGPTSPRRSDPRTVAWLKDKLHELGGGREPEQAVIDWRTVTYDLDEQRPPTYISTDRTVVTFRGPA
jgi:hypothetical protein